MAEKRLADIDALLEEIDRTIDIMGKRREHFSIRNLIMCIKNAPTVDAVEVVHGRWERCGGDLHSSGYAIYCSVCNKTHFVHYKNSLGGLYGCKELFEKPKYCPSCGAVMEVEE